MSASMLRAIVCIEIPLSALVGKYKLSQNRSAADRAGLEIGRPAQQVFGCGLETGRSGVGVVHDLAREPVT